MRIATTMLVAALLTGAPGMVRAAGTGAAAARLVRDRCAGCHGPTGFSTSDQYPNLAGQKAPYLRAQLRAFKDGRRPNPIMRGIAASLDERQMRELAVYFSRQRCAH